jgi:hypothetical protein
MPLPNPGQRELLHVRNIDMRGYRRDDGLYEIEGHLTDVRTRRFQPPGRQEAVEPGQPIHEMWVRLVVDESLVVAEVVARTDAGPYPDCPKATASLARLQGSRIGAGWTARVKSLLGAESCTHLVELLVPLATAAYQTLAEVRFQRGDELDPSGLPKRVDSCFAYARDRQLVRKRWPAFFARRDEDTR